MLDRFYRKMAIRRWSTVFPGRVLARRKTQSWEQYTESIVAICFRPYLNHAIWHCVLFGETRFHVEFGILWCQHGPPNHIQVYIWRSGEIHWWHLLGPFYHNFWNQISSSQIVLPMEESGSHSRLRTHAIYSYALSIGHSHLVYRSLLRWMFLWSLAPARFFLHVRLWLSFEGLFFIYWQSSRI